MQYFYLDLDSLNLKEILDDDKLVSGWQSDPISVPFV